MERATPDSGCDCVDRLASLPVRAVCVHIYMHLQLLRPPADQHEYSCRVLLQIQTAAAATKLYTVWKRQLVGETGATIHSTWIQCGMRVFECACKYARPNSLTYALARTICHTCRECEDEEPIVFMATEYVPSPHCARRRRVKEQDPDFEVLLPRTHITLSISLARFLSRERSLYTHIIHTQKLRMSVCA